jgi:hypothetical protein
MFQRVTMVALSREVPVETVRRRLSGYAIGAEKGRGSPALQPGFPRDKPRAMERRPSPGKASGRERTRAYVPSQSWLIPNCVSQTGLHLDHQPWIRTSNRHEKSVHETQIGISVWLTTPPRCMTRCETSPESEEQRGPTTAPLWERCAGPRHDQENERDHDEDAFAMVLCL